MILKIKPIAWVMLAAVLIGLPGCGASGSPSATPASSPGQAAAASSSGLDKAPLSILVAGDRPRQQDDVLREIDRVTANDLNIDLAVTYYPWDDYVNQVNLKATAGEEFDIYLDFFSEFAENIAWKRCIALNGLLDRYGQDLKEKIPQNYWDSMTVGGKIYAVPTVYAMTEMGRSLLVRKDIRLKYNLPEITDQATLELFLDTVARNEKDVIPFLGASLNFITCDKSFVGHSVYRSGGDFGYLYVDTDKLPIKVENFFRTDVFRRIWEENKKAYNSGWFERGILTDMDRDGKFIAGKAASMDGDLYNIADRQSQLRKNVPDGEVELAIINKDGRWINMSPVNNFAMVSSTSKRPDRAVMFLNWLRKSQDNYDLYMLGIKGKTYNLVGGEAEVPAGADPKDRFDPTPWFAMHFPYLRTWTTDPPAYKAALDFWRSLKPEDSPLVTFAYSNENVKAEAAAVDKIIDDTGKPLFTGILSTEADYQKLLGDLDNAGMQKILDDMQNQIDAYMASKKN